jgi:protein-disulfide isomerase
MTSNDNSNRIPLLAAVIGFALLLVVGAYLFWRNDWGAGAASGDDKAQLASSQADKALSAAGMNEDDRKATEAVVRAYILENPEIITEAVEILQKRQVADRLKASGNAITKAFYGAEAGNPKGDITVVEFTDYNCGYCRSSVADVERLLADDKNIRLVYRELPILSATSREAALWALAAAKQGKHSAFHTAMFTGGRPDASTIKAAAQRAGVDMAAAEKFAASDEAAAEVDANLAMMQQIGFNGTPTFIIGDQILEGALGYDALKAAVAKARRQS